MIRLTIKPLLQFLVFIVVGISIPMNAQETQTYNGPLQIGKYNGKATYSYKLVENDTVLDGDFTVLRSNLQELLEKQDYSFQFKGAFVDGTANGPWKFQFGEFNSKSQSEVIDYQYRVLVSGIQKSAAGKIKMGKPNGKWTILEEQIENSEISSTLFKSVVSFDNGVPQQNFSINNENYTLVGRFLRDGLAHDEWSLFPSNGMDQSESWYFKDGILQSIRVDDDNDHKTIQAYKGYSGETRVINLDAGYIKALEIQLSQVDVDILHHNSLPELLKQNAARYQEVDGILSELGKSEFLPEFKVKVPYYPLDSSQIRKVDSIVSYYKKANELSESILHNSQLNILRLSDTNTAYQYNTVLQLKENYLKPIQEIVSYDSLGILEYTSQEQLVNHVFANGMPKSEMDIEIQVDSVSSSKSYTIPTTSLTKSSNSNIENIEAVAKMGYDGILAIANEVKETLAQEKRQNELASLEEEIILQNDSLVSFIIATNDSIPLKYANSLQQIKSFANTTLNDYSKVKSAQNRLIAARSTVKCLDNLNELSSTVSQMPAYKTTIEESYTDRIWNPFMATLMDEDIKKKITSAYSKILEPYFLAEIEQHLSCDIIEDLNNTITATYKKVLELKDQDTKKLERKLKKEKDPVTVLEMLNVQNTTKQ
ncbi:hypothetical protein QSV08_05560 [Maribacter sp. BPC-D8]|uniref:hypothetical protein n=1 Tax=Maribacter sp. BPC-D8 TaxID=3053613 RepID=UPI002B4772C3|nr:hypothetical protein [Maribacter sp. BPC-D8]WRI30709.1 hypothetical protein QSV08_05560 [Maribacter sp. BPC-D8]